MSYTAFSPTHLTAVTIVRRLVVTASVPLDFLVERVDKVIDQSCVTQCMTESVLQQLK